MTPYELGILLDVYSGAPISANPAASIFAETMAMLVSRGFIQPTGLMIGHEYVATTKLQVFVEHILKTPDPVWRMP